MADAVEARTLNKVARFIPFLVLCYFVAYLDRVNVGFAKLTMDADLGLSETAYGFGAGVFFLAYFLFEVPSNIIMDKVGARVWIARIMLSWGVVSGAMAFIPSIARATGISPEYTFYLLRVLLGFAEAGFFPGIIFFLTLWFPASYRARIVGYFMAAIPGATAAPARNAVGRVQKIGSEAKTPKEPTVSAIILVVGSVRTAEAPMPIAASASEIARCMVRSPLRSERMPHQIMPRKPTT